MTREKKQRMNDFIVSFLLFISTVILFAAASTAGSNRIDSATTDSTSYCAGAHGRLVFGLLGDTLPCKMGEVGAPPRRIAEEARGWIGFPALAWG